MIKFLKDLRLRFVGRRSPLPFATHKQNPRKAGASREGREEESERRRHPSGDILDKITNKRNPESYKKWIKLQSF